MMVQVLVPVYYPVRYLISSGVSTIKCCRPFRANAAVRGTFQRLHCDPDGWARSNARYQICFFYSNIHLVEDLRKNNSVRHGLADSKSLEYHYSSPSWHHFSVVARALTMYIYFLCARLCARSPRLSWVMPFTDVLMTLCDFSGYHRRF